MDVLSVVNGLLALALIVIEARNIRRDRRKNRWQRWLSITAGLYIVAIYAHFLAHDVFPGADYLRPGNTLIITALVARAIYDLYRIPVARRL